MFRFIFIFITLVSTQANAKTATETARDYYDALEHEDYGSAATYFDPVALREFRSLMSLEKRITEGQKLFFFEEFFEPDLNDSSIEKLSDTDFFAAFLHGVLSSESFSQMLKYKNVEILGEIQEREDLAHVVTRQWISLGGNKTELIEVTSFNKVAGEWKIRMTGKLKSVAVMIRQQFLGQ